jgi:hypothetical protein
VRIELKDLVDRGVDFFLKAEFADATGIVAYDVDVKHGSQSLV